MKPISDITAIITIALFIILPGGLLAVIAAVRHWNRTRRRKRTEAHIDPRRPCHFVHSERYRLITGTSTARAASTRRHQHRRERAIYRRRRNRRIPKRATGTIYA